MSILDVLRQNQQFYSDLDQGVVSGNRLPLLPNEDVMYGSVIPNIDYSVSPQNENEDEENLDISRFENMDLQPGYLDRAGSFGTNYNFNQPNFFQRMFNKASDIYGSGRDLIGTGISSLANLVTGNPLIGGVMSLISRMGTPMSSYQMSDLQRRGYGDELSRIYGPGGIMQGYNPVSIFGRGPLESIINRRNKILARKEAGKAYGASNLTKLNKAITSLGGSTDSNLSSYRASRPASERRSTGPAGGGRDNTGGDKGAKNAADSFSNRSGMGRTGY